MDGIVLPLGLVDYILVDLCVSTVVEFLVLQYLLQLKGRRGLKLAFLVNLASLTFGVGLHLFDLWVSVLQYPSLIQYVWPRILWLDQEIWGQKLPILFIKDVITSPFVTFPVTLLIEGVLLYFFIPRIVGIKKVDGGTVNHQVESHPLASLAYYLLPMNGASYVVLMALVPLYQVLSFLPGFSGVITIVFCSVYLYRRKERENSRS